MMVAEEWLLLVTPSRERVSALSVMVSSCVWAEMREGVSFSMVFWAVLMVDVSESAISSTCLIAAFS